MADDGVSTERTEHFDRPFVYACQRLPDGADRERRSTKINKDWGNIGRTPTGRVGVLRQRKSMREDEHSIVIIIIIIIIIIIKIIII